MFNNDQMLRSIIEPNFKYEFTDIFRKYCHVKQYS